MLYYYEGFQFDCLGSLWLRSYQNKIPEGHKTDVGEESFILTSQKITVNQKIPL